MTGMNPLGYRMAVGVALLFPLLVIFLIANKYFIQDIGGAEKG
jgi:ABC-type glycerol-3-phosphate transport system permease component